MNWGFAATAASKSAPSRRPGYFDSPLALWAAPSPLLLRSRSLKRS
jgi:hypothetical protein